ncbi:MAG: thiol reductant ABC exporter subunit CydD [Actinomycetota bacterium]
MKPLDPRLLRYARSSATFLVLATVLGLIRTACTIAFCWLLAQGISDAVRGRPLVSTIALLVVVVAVRAGAVWATDAAAAAGAAKVKSQLRRRFMTAIAALGPSWLGRRNRAEVATTAVDGLEALDGYFALFLPQLVLTVVSTPLIVVMMFTQDALSGIIVIATLPLIPVFMILIGWATQAAQQRQWTTLTHLSGRFLDVVNGLATLKIFGREKRQESRLAAVTEDYRSATMKVLRLSFLSGFALELIATLSVALVAVSIGLRLVNGSLGLEVGLFVLLLAPEAFLPVRLVGANYHAAADGVAAATDVFAILDEAQGDQRSAPITSSARLHEVEVVVDDLTVLLSERTVLDHLSFTARPFELTVLAGPSGAGKSTVLAAMLGFAGYDGAVTGGGRALTRDAIAWSRQRPVLVTGSVADNVALGDPARDALMILRALDLAGAADLDPARRLDARAEGLSGGQAERVSIARAIYRCLTRDCPVILLDEPSAALDSATEARLVEGLRQLAAEGRTVIVTSHRSAVIGAADSVIELKERADVR